MDVQDLINRNGKKEIPNPNYNPNSKKNTVPPTITVDDLDPLESTDPGLLKSIANSTPLLSGDDIEKYRKYGINYNRREANLIGSRNLDYQLAEAQSNWEKAGNALLQTVVSEIGLGTIGGFVDLFDFVASKVFGAGEDDYQSELGNAIRNAQEGFRNNVAPIYQRPGSNIQNGGMGDFGWWMSNIPSIASSLTLLIPARAVSAGVSTLGRVAGKGLSKVQAINKFNNSAKKWLQGANRIEAGKTQNLINRAFANPLIAEKANVGARITAEGLLMRTMENYQESRQVNIDTKQEALSKFNNMSDEEFAEWVTNNRNLLDNNINTASREDVANNIAKKAADRTFTMDFSNVVFDIIQLYGLRNLGKAVKDLGHTGGSARILAAQRESIEQTGAKLAGKEIKELSKAKKILNTGIDASKAFGANILRESTEGIEEAVNYIAQQEGLSYGKALLEGKDDNYKLPSFLSIPTLGIPNIISTWNNLQNPLNDYLKSPELQDSAFWGLMGGITFGLLGSGLNRLQFAQAVKAEQKRSKIALDEEDAEWSWMNLLQSPTVRAATTAFNNRLYRLEKLKSNLHDIEENDINIYSPLDENNQHSKFVASNEDDLNQQKELAKARAIEEVKTDMVMDALNSGTFTMLLDYINADNVKDAFVELGFTTKEDADSFAEEFTNRAKAIKERYDKQASKMAALSTALNATLDKDEEIPIDYIRMFAHANTVGLNDIDSLTKLQSITDKLISDEEAKVLEGISDDKKDEKRRELDEYKHLMELYVLGTHYGAIQANIKKLEEKENLSVEEYSNLKHQKNELKRIQQYLATQYVATSVDAIVEKYNNASAIATVLKFASSMRYNPGKDRTKSGYTRSNSFADTDEEIIRQTRELIPDLQIEDEDVLKQLFNKNYRRISDINNKTDKFKENNSSLYYLYYRRISLSEEKNVQYEHLINTKDDLKAQKEIYDFRFRKAKTQLIQSSIDKVKSIYKNYATDENNKEILDEALRLGFTHEYDRVKEVLKDIASKEMIDSLVDAIKVLTQSEATEYDLYELIDKELVNEAQKARSGDTETDSEEGENFSASQADDSGSQNAGSVSSSQAGRNRVSGQENGTDGNISPESNPQPAETIPFNISEVDGKLNIKEGDDNSIIIAVRKPNSQNEYELKFSREGEREIFNVVKAYSYLFEGDKTNAIGVETYPTIRKSIVNGITSWKVTKGTWKLSSTGGEESSSDDTSKLDKVLPDITTQISINKDSFTTVETINEFIESLNNKFNPDNDEEITNKINELMQMFKDALEAKEEIADDDEKVQIIEDAASDVWFASTYMRAIDDEYAGFDGAFNKFIDLLERNLVLRKDINGKIIIKASDIINLCKRAYKTTNDAVVKFLYDTIIEKLDKNKFTLIEEIEADVINSTNSKPPIEEIFDSFRVDIHSVLDDDFNPDRDLVAEALEQTKEGDELHIVNVGEEFELHKNIKHRNLDGTVDDVDVVVGRLPIPYRTEDGTFVTYNLGVQVVIRKDGISETIPYHVNALTDDNLISIINSYIVAKYNNSDTREIVYQFANHPTIRQWSKQSIAAYKEKRKRANIFFVEQNGTINYNNIIEFYSRLVEYYFDKGINLNSDSVEIAKQQLTDSIEEFFKKLYDNYIAITNLTENTPENVIISDINDGELQYKTYREGNTVEDIDNIYNDLVLYDTLSIFRNKVDENGNPIYTAHLGVVVGGEGYVISGTDGIVTDKLPGTGNTYVFIKTPHGKLVPAKAYGVRVSDTSNKEAQKLFKSIGETLYSIVTPDDWTKNGKFKNKDAIKARIESLLKSDYKNTTISLLQSRLGNVNINIVDSGERKIQIEVKDARGKILSAISLNYNESKTQGYHLTNITQTFKNGEQLSKSKYIKISERENDNNTSPIDKNKTVNNILEWLKEIKAEICIDKNGLKWDNNKTIVSNSPLLNFQQEALRLSGKSYKNYSDFLLKAGLVKLNIAQDVNGRIFKATGRNLKHRQNLKVQLPIKQQQEEVVSTIETESLAHYEKEFDVDVNTRTELLNIIPNVNALANSDTKALDNSYAIIERLLANTVDGRQLVDALSALVKGLDEKATISSLFPNMVAYDPNGNVIRIGNDGNISDTGVNAYSTSTGTFRTFTDNGRETTRTLTTLNAKNERVPKVRTILTPRVVSALSSKRVGYRNEGIRVLMHERIHERLRNLTPEQRKQFNKEISKLHSVFLNTLKQEYRDVCSALNTDGNLQILKDTQVSKENKFAEESKEILSKRKQQIETIWTEVEGFNRKNETIYEEFLVNSLTHADVYQYVNKIEYEDTETNKKENLLIRLINTVARLFGWKEISEKSILKKELDLLNNFLNNNETQESVEDVKSKIKLDDNQDDLFNENEEQSAEAYDFDIDENSTRLKQNDYNASTTMATGYQFDSEKINSERGNIYDTNIHDFLAFANTLENSASFIEGINNGEISVKCN